MEENKGIKVTNAVYRILDCLPDSDPLKNKAKEKALAILENLTLVFSAQDWVSFQKEKAAASVMDDIGILQGYLQVGRDQGWIDAMNFLIITKEYQSIKNSIVPPRGLIKQSLQIAQATVKEAPRVAPAISTQAGYMQSEKSSKRQRKILEILQKREKTQVSDIIKELPNITKRTIRRDLDDLLKSGKVARMGEWNQIFYQIK